MFGSHAILVTVLAGAVAGGTSILFGALGEVISERAGVINVGTEGTMLVGGALAGLGGAVQYAGMEGQLRPGVAATFGYTGFLASWLARHQPAKVIAAAFLLASIAVAGNAIQLSSHLPGSAVNILMAVVLLAVLAQRPKVKAT